MKKSNTLGALKKTAYTPLSIQQELAKNLRARMQSGQPTFEGLLGYENTCKHRIGRSPNVNYLVLIFWIGASK